VLLIVIMILLSANGLIRINMWSIRNSKLGLFIQRGKRGYDSTSHWSADNYLAGVIGGVLNDLADNSHGTPIFEDYCIDGDFEDMDHDLWVKDIRHVADTLIRYSEHQFDSEYECPDPIELANVFSWLGKYWEGLWD
jgi:hypothetical protein